MKATCPSCGAGGSVELFIADAEWREAILEAARLPSDCGGPVLRYIGMFRPGNRFLTPDRSARLIREVCAMIIDGVDFDRQHLNAPSHVWRAAIIEMLDAPNVQRPLKNHNYLLRIMQSKLGQKADQSQIDRVATRRNNEVTRDRGSSMQPIGEVIDEQPLPDLPEDSRTQWLATAGADLIENYDLKEGYMSEFLIESRARELYAESLK